MRSLLTPTNGRSSQDAARTIRVLTLNEKGDRQANGAVIADANGNPYRIMEDGRMQRVMIRDVAGTPVAMTSRRLSRKEKKAIKRARHSNGR